MYYMYIYFIILYVANWFLFTRSLHHTQVSLLMQQQKTTAATIASAPEKELKVHLILRPWNNWCMVTVTIIRFFATKPEHVTV